mmetsp:Transcript_6268/g.19613  ORF Transcript_6268/g.19613 Transcript_6268/m.19613 type:complete len:208 (+) Transcript_6268:340-963(+)
MHPPGDRGRARSPRAVARGEPRRRAARARDQPARRRVDAAGVVATAPAGGHGQRLAPDHCRLARGDKGDHRLHGHERRGRQRGGHCARGRARAQARAAAGQATQEPRGHAARLSRAQGRFLRRRLHVHAARRRDPLQRRALLTAAHKLWPRSVQPKAAGLREIGCRDSGTWACAQSAHRFVTPCDVARRSRDGYAPCRISHVLADDS